MDEYLQSPERWEDGKHARQAVPVWFSIPVALMRDCNISEDRAWNMPFLLTSAYLSANAEANGDENIVTPEEKVAMTQADKAEKQDKLNGKSRTQSKAIG